MTDRLTIALAQLNPKVGDLAGNRAGILAARAAAGKADLVVTQEMSLVGYAPEDMVLKPAFQEAAHACAESLAAATADDGPALVVGTPWVEEGRLYNAVLLLEGGRIAARVLKHHLPNYGVFDEKRVFAAGPPAGPVDFRGLKLGLMVCEDMWFADVPRHLADAGADILIAPTASPFEIDKAGERLAHGRARAAETGLPLLMVNQVGGQDEVIFDGTSFIVHPDGEVPACWPGFVEHVALTRWQRGAAGWRCAEGERHEPFGDLDAIWQACMTGLRDYVTKNGFPGVLVGLSGGLDSALSAAIAVDALGADRVHTVMMPSRFTGPESREDANACARLLGVRHDTVAIGPGVAAFGEMLAPLFAGTAPGVMEENIQSRLRGMILMALSNKFGHLVLTTGNKSEVSVGYATLYGDMCGGYSVLKDIYKTTCFALARRRNAHHPTGALGPRGPVMPGRVITKPPTAELRDNQKDEDSLPPYEILDDILACLVERNMAIDAIIALGHPRDTVVRVETLLYGAEYKRRQAAPGVKITRKSFGRDRRYPITNGFRTAVTPCP